MEVFRIENYFCKGCSKYVPISVTHECNKKPALTEQQKNAIARIRLKKLVGK